jgi:DNA-binding response OmpR family regulator
MTPHIAVFNHQPSLLRLLEAVLGQKGYRVSTHLQELEHLDDVARLEPDGIILGYLTGYLPHELDIIRRLREHPRLRRVPVLVCCSSPLTVSDLGESADVGPVRIVEKPFEISDLLRSLEEVLRANGASTA